MGTNFYWKRLPLKLQKINDLLKKQAGRDIEELLYHIGKRSAAGRYCYTCGTTFNRHGTAYVHSGDSPWYEVCPICGSEGENSISFTWTFMLQKKIIEDMIEDSHFRCTTEEDYIIKDEYNRFYSPTQFMSEINTPIQFQAADYFS